MSDRGGASICVPICSDECGRRGRAGGACVPAGTSGADADADGDGDAPDVEPDADHGADRIEDGDAADEAEAWDESTSEEAGAEDAGGGEGDPCSGTGTCRDPFVCIDGFCRPGILARFCHCLATSGGDYIYLTLHLNEYVFPPVRTLSCSPCQRVPGGRVYLQAYRDSGSLHGAAWLDMPETTSGELTLFVTTSEFLAFDVGCSDTMSCP